ncbi:MAG: bacterioferritin [Thioalkalivibrionaceae bacterium]
MDSRLIGYFQRALTHEFSATRQYLAQHHLVRSWGFEAEAENLRSEVDEELAHADALMGRLIAYGAQPSAAAGGGVRLGRSMRELLEANRILEQDAVRLYREAGAYAARVRAFEDARLFARLESEEQAHLDEVVEALARL